jgi:hypothetical protein
MDIGALTQGITLLGSAVDTIKKVIDTLPDNPRKEEAEVALEKAEDKFKTAQARIADELGYELCRQHFPPEVMLSADNKYWTCPECGNDREIKSAGIVKYA